MSAGSELGEHFNALREESRARRERNRLAGPAILGENGVVYQTRNEGAHLVIHGGDGQPIADYWPGTGKWQARKLAISGRGVFKLIRWLKGQA